MYVDFIYLNEVNCFWYIYVKKDVEVYDYLLGSLWWLMVVLINKMCEMEIFMSVVENELKSILFKDVE